MSKVITPEFRVSFPAVFQPKAFENQAPKYSLVMLFDKSEDLSKLKALAKEAIALKWPDPAKKPKGLRNPIRDGDAEKPDIQGYAGCMFINTSSKMKPGLIDKDNNQILSEDEFYAGCYAKASVTAYAYDKMGNKGVAFGLQNIRKERDGEPFSGRSTAEEDFGSSSGMHSAPDSAEDEMYQ